MLETNSCKGEPQIKVEKVVLQHEEQRVREELTKLSLKGKAELSPQGRRELASGDISV